jgi:predicted dehydrogenase
VGCGSFGARHATAWAEVPGTVLAAVCDHHAERVAAMAARTGAATVADIADLPADLDAVSVAVQPQLLAGVGAACLERGLHMLLEKPFGMAPADADRLAALAAARGLILQAGYLESFHPAFRRAVALAGRPRRFTARRMSKRPPFGAAVGVVHDLMCHDLEHAVELGGPIATIGTEILREPSGAPIGYRARLGFASGFAAILETGYTEEERTRRLTIEGTTGTVTVNMLDGTLRAGEAEETVPVGNPLASQFAAFAASVRSGAAPRVGPDRAREVLRACAEIATAG